MVQTRTDVNNAKAVLNTILARDPATVFDVDLELEIPSLPERDELFKEIETANPDVIAARYAVTAASAHAREATASFLPEIAIQGAYRVARSTSDAGFFLQNTSNGPSVGLTFQWNVLNGMADRYERERRQIIAVRNQFNVEGIRNDVRGMADRALRSYNATSDVLAIQRASYAAAERNAGVALEKLRVGAITPLEVRQTFQTLLEVGQQVARLEYEQRLAATEVLRLAGRLAL